MTRPSIHRPEFNPAKPVVVRRPFTAGGRHFKPGDDFDWRRLSVSQRRAKQLYDMGKLRHAEESPVVQRNASGDSMNSYTADVVDHSIENDNGKVSVSFDLKNVEEMPAPERASTKPEQPDTTAYPKHAGGPWYILSDGTKIKGKAKAKAAQEALNS